jgi:glycogen phosphorylase
VYTGGEDLDRAAAALAARIPWKLAPLARAAYNYRWAWVDGGPAVFRDVDPHRWRECGGNPVRLLQEASADALVQAAADRSLVARAEALEREIRSDLERPPAPGSVAPERPVAYFCAEYAVHVSLPIYSGGLGALAGDVLKAASDRALPLVGVGLMYRRGYFRQRIDRSGWQQEYWVPTDPERCPAVRITRSDGSALTVTVPVAGEAVRAQVWRVDVGRVPLYLLDTEVPENPPLARWITSRLYDGDPDTRLAQYTLLGVGGMRCLEALDITPSIIHMNEGHAALVALAGAGRERTVFTTHTPVAAGNDSYPAEQIREVVAPLVDDPEEVVRAGRTHPDDPWEPFGVTQFALRNSRAANGVSRRHGEVARRMWHGLWPDRDVDDVPIGHVTNGVHMPSWVGTPMRELLDRRLGAEWALRLEDAEAFAEGIAAIPDEELWAVRCRQRALLAEFVRERSVNERAARGESRGYAQAAADAFDPNALTVGFARRLATYKRLNLVLADAERALRVLGGDRPIQLVLAGKAHPRDDDGKRLVQGLFEVREHHAVAGRVVYVEDYDLGVAARLVRGCDVWVNVPRPPLEASGTSGMKNVVNGGLQLSVLDGWWSEAYDGTNGWALPGDEQHDHDAQDARDAAELYRLLEDEVLPQFYARDESGVPAWWVARVKASMGTLIPQFSAGRMLREYEQRLYAASAVTGT